jgi:hypothetical protein
MISELRSAINGPSVATVCRVLKLRKVIIFVRYEGLPWEYIDKQSRTTDNGSSSNLINTNSL